MCLRQKPEGSEGYVGKLGSGEAGVRGSWGVYGLSSTASFRPKGAALYDNEIKVRIGPSGTACMRTKQNDHQGCTAATIFPDMPLRRASVTETIAFTSLGANRLGKGKCSGQHT